MEHNIKKTWNSKIGQKVWFPCEETFMKNTLHCSSGHQVIHFMRKRTINALNSSLTFWQCATTMKEFVERGCM